jgi:hypothetical protein
MSFRESLCALTTDELESQLREASDLNQRQRASVQEVIDFYRDTILGLDDPFRVAEFCGRAIADVTHEIAAAKHGYDSPEADAVFDEQDRHLTCWLRQLDSIRAKQQKNAA